MQPKGKADPKGGHVRLYWDLLDSHAWHALSAVEVHLYMSMRRQLKGSNNGDISATLSTLRHFGIRSSATLAKGLRALQAVGLIAKTRDVGGLTHGGALCCLYRFTDLPVSPKPSKGVASYTATHDYRRWPTKAAADAAIERAHREALRPEHPNAGQAQSNRAKEKAKVQLLNCVGSETELRRFNSCAMPSRIGSANEPTQEGSTAPWHASETEHLYMLPGQGPATRQAKVAPSDTRMAAILAQRMAARWPRSDAYEAARAKLSGHILNGVCCISSPTSA
jgi:hypothetical protein